MEKWKWILFVIVLWMTDYYTTHISDDDDDDRIKQLSGFLDFRHSSSSKTYPIS